MPVGGPDKEGKPFMKGLLGSLPALKAAAVGKWFLLLPQVFI